MITASGDIKRENWVPPYETQEVSAPAWDLKVVRSIHNFLSGLSEPSMLPAYLAGGMTYRLLRWGAAGSWVANSAVKTLSSLLLRQVGASTVALSGEVAAFTAAQHGARALYDLPHPHEVPLDKEMAGTAIMLSSLRGFGFGAGLLGGALQRAGLVDVAGRSLLSLAGSYGGLLAAQEVEHRLLYPGIPQDGNPFVNAAVSLLHFTGFGIIARRFTPQIWQNLETQLEQRTHKLFSNKWQEIHNGFPSETDAMGLIWQTTGDPLASRSSLSPTSGIKVILNHSRPAETPHLVEFYARLTLLQRELLPQLFQNLSVGRQRLAETLAHSQLIGTDRFDLALRRLAQVAKATSMKADKENGVLSAGKTEDNKSEGAKSSYINWITRWGFERIVKLEKVEDLDRMINLITQPTPRPEYENFLSTYFPEGLLPPLPPAPSKRSWTDLFKRKNPVVKAIDTLPVNDSVKTTLRRWQTAQTSGNDSAPFFIPEKQFLHLLENFQKMNDNAKWAFAESILTRAADSPLGLLRIHRLFQILQSEMQYDARHKTYRARGFLGTKLRELWDDKFHIQPAVPEAPHENTNFNYGAAGGHLGEHGPRDLLRPLLTQMPDLLDPVKQEKRKNLRRIVLEQFLEEYPGKKAYDRGNMAEAFQRLHQAFGKENFQIEIEGVSGDFSFHIAQALLSQKINLEALPEVAYQKRVHQINRAIAKASGVLYHEGIVPERACFFPCKNGEKHPILEKPTILIKISEPDPGWSMPGAPDLYFEDLKSAAHEWMHLEQSRQFSHGRLRPWSESAQLKQEAATHLTHLWFGAQHGDAQDLARLGTEGLGGFMMRWLDDYEPTYKKYWQN